MGLHQTKMFLPLQGNHHSEAQGTCPTTQEGLRQDADLGGFTSYQVRQWTVFLFVTHSKQIKDHEVTRVSKLRF